MANKWDGLDLNDIYDDWGSYLSSCSLAQISHAIDLSIEKEYPPNLGEFMGYCKLYQPPVLPSDRYIDNRSGETNPELAKAKLAEIKVMLTKKMTA